MTVTIAVLMVVMSVSTAPVIIASIVPVVIVPAASVVPSVVTIVIVVAMSAVTFTVSWCEIIAIPAVLYEVNRAAAGMVAIAIALPVFIMARRYTQVHRLIHIYHVSMNDNRFTIDNAWLGVGVVTNVNLTIKARLTYAD